jgi:hypothetical protein
MRSVAFPRKHHLGAEQRRALQLLASIPFGAAEATMHAHGFTRQTLVRLVRAGLATADSTTVKADDKGDRGRPRPHYGGWPTGAGN